MPQAISYIRFSSTQQGVGSTTDRQRKLIDKWLQDNPEFTESPLSEQDLGKSAFKKEHEKHGFGRLLDAIRQDRIQAGDVILVEHIDRIGRYDLSNMLSTILSILQSGVSIITLEDQQVYSKESLDSSNASIYFLVGKVQQAGQYSENLSRRIRAAYERKRKQAKNGEKIKIFTPFWLTSKGKIIPERGEIVKKCIDLYLTGYGTRGILLELREQYPELDSVHPSTLKRWFQNEALYGVWQNKNDPIANVFEPLVDEATYLRLAGELERRRVEMSPAQKHGLSGLIKCANCGARFYFRTKKYRGEKIVYANCSTYLKRGKPYCDNNKTWPYEALWTIFLMSFDETVVDLTWERAKGSLGEALAEIDQKISNVTNKIETLIETVLEKLPDQPLALTRLEQLEAERKDLETERQKIEYDAKKGERPSKEVVRSLFEEAIGYHSEYTSDPVKLRTELYKAGYRIEIQDDIAFVESSLSGFLIFKLEWRSTQYKCYFIEHTIPDSTDVEDSYFDFLDLSRYLAVDRHGVIALAEDPVALIEFLHLNRELGKYHYRFDSGIQSLRAFQDEFGVSDAERNSDIKDVLGAKLPNSDK